MKTVFIRMLLCAGFGLLAGCAAMPPVEVRPPGGAAFSASGPPDASEIETARKNAAANPQDWRGYNELGLAYFRARNYDGAVTAFEQALALHPITTMVEAEQQQQQVLDAQRAAMLQHQKRAEEVQAGAAMSQMFSGLLGSMVSMPGASPELMYMAPALSATVSATAQIPTTAAPEIPRTTVDSQMKPRTEVATIQFNLGRAQLERGAYSSASAAFEQTLALDPTQVEAIQWQAQAAYRLSKYIQAIGLANRYRAIGAVPSPEMLLWTSDAYRTLGMRIEAGKCANAAVVLLKKTLAGHPENADAIRLLVRAHMTLEQSDQALKLLQRECLRSTSGSWLLDLAAVYTHQGLPREALANARAALDRFLSKGENLYALYLAGLAHEDMGQREEAQRAFCRLCELADGEVFDDSLESCVAVAMAYAGRAEEGRRIIEMRLHRAPWASGSAVEYYRLGLVLRKDGQDAMAMEAFRRALVLRPINAPARRGLEALQTKWKQETAQWVSKADAALTKGATREALDLLSEAYRLTAPGEHRKALHGRILQLAGRMDSPPSFPSAAQKHFLKGNAALRSAKDPLDLDRAISEFEWASLYAPWEASVYLSTSAAQGVRQRYADSAESLRLYLSANPKAANVTELLGKLAEMEYQQAEALRQLSSIQW